MAYSNIQYYNQNVLRGLPNWTLFDTASVSDDNIIINGGGYAGCVLDNSYFSALSASLYRRLEVSVTMDTSLLSNYQNNVEVVLVGTYINNQGEYINLRSSVNLTLLNSNITSQSVTMSRVISFLNYDFVNLTVYVINNTQAAIVLNTCTMLRSQDISDSQIGSAFGFAITLKKVIDHPNGAQLFYEGIEKDDHFYWIEDAAGKFAGINVNNNFRINYEYDDSILTD